MVLLSLKGVKKVQRLSPETHHSIPSPAFLLHSQLLQGWAEPPWTSSWQGQISDLNQQPVITLLLRGLFLQTGSCEEGREATSLEDRAEEVRPCGLWCERGYCVVPSTRKLGTLFYWNYIKNGSQGQALGYLQSKSPMALRALGGRNGHTGLWVSLTLLS